MLLGQGADAGVFGLAEHEMVTNVLNLDDRHVGSVLTPRSDIVFRLTVPISLALGPFSAASAKRPYAPQPECCIPAGRSELSLPRPVALAEHLPPAAAGRGRGHPRQLGFRNRECIMSSNCCRHPVAVARAMSGAAVLPLGDGHVHASLSSGAEAPERVIERRNCTLARLLVGFDGVRDGN